MAARASSRQFCAISQFSSSSKSLSVSETPSDAFSLPAQTVDGGVSRLPAVPLFSVSAGSSRVEKVSCDEFSKPASGLRGEEV